MYKNIVHFALLLVTPMILFSQITVLVSTDKTAYDYMEDIHITVTAYNATNNPITLSWGDMYNSNYFIDNYHPQIFVIQIPNSITIEPDSSYSWYHTHSFIHYPVSPGPHLIRGEVVNYGISPPIMITVLPPLFPDTPILISPANADTIFDPTPYFDWTDSPLATYYEIQVDTDSLFLSPSINASVIPSNYTAIDSLQDSTYYWRVRALNVGNASDWSFIWHFTLDANVTPPVADFSATPTSGTVPLIVQFTNESTGIIDSLTWDFGDGQFSNEQNPIHTYTNIDTYTVSLAVTGPGGTDTLTKQDYIAVNAPSNYLFVSPTIMPVSSNSGSTIFNVFSNISWSVFDNSDWLNIAPTNGSNNGTLFAVYSANTSTNTRIDTITVTGDGLISTVYLIQDGITGIDFSENSVPEYFVLFHNYPNPFNPTTNIIYGLPSISNVIIEVYNLLGTKVSTLINKKMPQGYHTIQFDGRNLPTGIYYCRMLAGEFRALIKMVYIK